MKKSTSTFAKLYGPKAKKGPKPILESPLGMGGQSGVSGFVQWGYASRVHAWSTVAHKQVWRENPTLMSLHQTTLCPLARAKSVYSPVVSQCEDHKA